MWSQFCTMSEKESNSQVRGPIKESKKRVGKSLLIPTSGRGDGGVDCYRIVLSVLDPCQ